MVNRGKPSRACGRCRLRRLKCDEGNPMCSACLRARVESCEYREVLGLSFRDESEKVVRKAQEKTTRKPSPCQGLTCPTWSLARGYMYTNYMTTNHFGGYLPCLVALTDRWPHSALPAAITAVGLAALANIRQCPRMMLEARQECTTAISLTKSALNNSVVAKRDDVLATVVMLSIFEVMTCNDSSSIRRWMGHLDGATKIMELREEEQLDTAEGLELFRHLRVGICLASIYRTRQSSAMLGRLTEKAKQFKSSQNGVVDDLAAAILRVNGFCADLKDGKSTTPGNTARTALRLDADIVASLLDAPSTSSYSVVKVNDVTGEQAMRQMTWGDAYHVYGSIAGSSMWNNYRTARIFLREIIIDALKAAENASDEQYQSFVMESRQVGRQLVDDICASVPFHLCSLIHHHTEASFGTENHSPLSTGPAGTGGVIPLLWPLLIAANSGFASTEQRSWIISCLDKIGRSTGIGQARAMAQLLRDGKETRAWLRTEEDL